MTDEPAGQHPLPRPVLLALYAALVIILIAVLVIVGVYGV